MVDAMAMKFYVRERIKIGRASVSPVTSSSPSPAGI